MRPINAFPYSDPDPITEPGITYPYFRSDGHSNRLLLADLKMIEPENGYKRLVVKPEIGGKIWEAYEKSKDYPFVFMTKAFKFRDIALRGP